MITKCPNCNLESSDSHTFCMHCGFDLRSTKTPNNDTQTNQIDGSSVQIHKDKSLRQFTTLLFVAVILAITVFFFLKSNSVVEERYKSDIDSGELANSPWVRNSLYGVSFETPDKITEQESEIPEGYEGLIIKQKTYLFKQNRLIVFFMFFDSKFETYDKEVGLSGSIGNMVKVMNGTDLSLNYQEPDSSMDDLKCNGSFLLNGLRLQVKGYVYWNNKGKAFILTTIGDSHDLPTMDKIFDSLRIAI